MKKVLNAILAALVLSSLSACVVVPPHAEYVGPRVPVVAPYPVYQPSYYYYGDPAPHRHHQRGWDRRW